MRKAIAMNQRASKAAAMPTVLVATLANRSGSGDRRKSRRLAPAREGIEKMVGGLGSIPKPSLGNLAGGRKRRQRRSRMMKLARNAGAVVSAISVAAELAGTVRDITGDGGTTKPAPKRAANRSSASPSKAKAPAKRAQSSTKAAATSRKTTTKKTTAPSKKTTAKKVVAPSKKTIAKKAVAPASKRAITQRSSSNGNASRNSHTNGHAATNGRSGASRPRAKAATRT